MIRSTRILAIALALSSTTALAQPPLGTDGQCVGDGNADAMVTIDELITAVNNSLEGCADRDIEISFAAAIGDESFTCGGVYEGIGAADSRLRLTDFRFYVSNLRLLSSNGEETPLELEQDGIWQRGDLALLDFEDGTNGCDFGNEPVNTSVRGTVPAGVYTGIRFDLGIPFDMNHGNAETETEPLNITAMFWNWNGGYKFIRVDGFGGPEESAINYNLHLGSTGCNGGSPLNPPSMPCANPNVPDVTLTGFNPDTNVIVADLATLLADANVETNQEGTAPGCQSFPADMDCQPVFPKLGLAYEDTPAQTQQFFRVQ